MIELDSLRVATNSVQTLDAQPLDNNVLLTISKLAGRQRRIEATIHLPHAIEQVWQVLTDYEGLAEFIPNLATSCRVPHPEGGIRIEQVGIQHLKVVTFSARVVLDMVEAYPSAIRFTMVEGDFKAFSGEWLLQAMPDSDGGGTRLTYILEVWAKATIPVIAIEQRLKKDLPQNLHAIRDRLAVIFP
jgi:ribosome-associated toxin RatA of RatAB toxin-antitoxin module